MHTDLLLTNTLRSHPRGVAVTRILAAALDAVEPAAAVRRALRRDQSQIWVGEHVYALTSNQRVVMLSIGKAGAPMLRAALDILGDCVTTALAVVKDGHTERLPADITIREAGHPIPDERGIAASKQVLQLLEGLNERDIVLVLISGGGSALLTLPADGISLADMRALTQALLGCGATIQEMNALRKHLERTKGGGLIQAAGAAQIVGLVLSDVVGDPLDVIASGPTFPDPSTYGDAWAVLERYAILDRVPAAIVTHLWAGRAGHISETLKPTDRQAQHARNVVVGNNRLAALAASGQAKVEGFMPMLLTTSMQGEARVAGEILSAILREAAVSGNPLGRPGCVIAGGETTVTLRGAGRGGRNQELALATVAPLAGLRDVLFITLATDGGDGPTDAAGAVVTGETLTRAQALGLDPAIYLAQNDAYTFFDALGDLLRPGPTLTNVNDLAFGLLY